MTEEEIKQFLSTMSNDNQTGAVDPDAGGGRKSGEGIKKVRFPALNASPRDRNLHTGLTHLENIRLIISAELGSVEMKFRDVLSLDVGSVVDLNKAAGDNINILLNDQPFALGEALVINEKFTVRFNRFYSPKSLVREDTYE